MESLSWAATSEAFANQLLLDGKSHETVRTYVSAFRLFFNWSLERETPPSQASHEFYALYYRELLNTSLSRKTITNRLNAARAFFRYVGREPSPTDGIKPPPFRPMPKRPVPVEDQRRLVYGAPSCRDEAINRLMIDSGCRVGEVAKMEIKDIHWSENLLLIRGKGSKQREVWISDETLRMIREYLDGRYQGPVWLNQYGEPLSRDAIRKNFWKLCKRQRVTAHPHQLRASFANAFLKAGGDLGALRVAMGHSDISTTAHYAASTENERALSFMKQLNLSARLV